MRGKSTYQRSHNQEGAIQLLNCKNCCKMTILKSKGTQLKNSKNKKIENIKTTIKTPVKQSNKCKQIKSKIT